MRNQILLKQIKRTVFFSFQLFAINFDHFYFEIEMLQRFKKNMENKFKVEFNILKQIILIWKVGVDVNACVLGSSWTVFLQTVL